MRLTALLARLHTSEPISYQQFGVDMDVSAFIVDVIASKSLDFLNVTA